jgi:hypothetical protein
MCRCSPFFSEKRDREKREEQATNVHVTHQTNKRTTPRVKRHRRGKRRNDVAPRRGREREGRKRRKLKKEFKISSISDLMVCTIEQEIKVEMWMNIKNIEALYERDTNTHTHTSTIKIFVN